MVLKFRIIKIRTSIMFVCVCVFRVNSQRWPNIRVEKVNEAKICELP